MIAVVEGIDRVGKTTLCNMLKAKGFIYLKDGQTLSVNPHEFPLFSAGKLDTSIQYLKKLHEAGFNIVVDRLHMTEAVYGTVDRGAALLDKCAEIDIALQREFGPNVCLVHVRATNIEEASERAGVDLREHEALFDVWYANTYIKNKFTTTYELLKGALIRIEAMATKYDFYFASPFFRPDQIEREERLKEKLRELGYKVFSPKENCNLSPISDPVIQDRVFKANCDSIRDSAAVFAITDTKDMGTIWEAGYAFGIGKPVLYYAETLGDGQFNLMLAKSGQGVFLNFDEVTREAIDEILYDGKIKEYGGIIE